MLTYPGPGGRDRWSLPNACREPCYGLFAAATDHSRRRGLKEAGCWRWLCACGYKRCSSSYRGSGCAGRPQGSTQYPPHDRAAWHRVWLCGVHFKVPVSHSRVVRTTAKGEDPLATYQAFQGPTLAPQ